MIFLLESLCRSFLNTQIALKYTSRLPPVILQTAFRRASVPFGPPQREKTHKPLETASEKGVQRLQELID
jgi:hypothetical protein